jgi:hypothetical protein
MPRKGKGGKVEGSTQTAYANRTDLNSRGPQPITAAPGEPYGQRQMLEDAQRAVPMGGTPQPATPVAQTPQTAPAPNPEPGSLLFDHPTQRPDEPITAGIHPTYGTLNQNTMGHVNLAATLEQAATSPNATPEIQMLAEIAKSLVP